MLSIGFDPAFIDTIVRVEDANNNLIDELPRPGYHHRLNSISRVAGGNGVNVASVLVKLGLNIDLITSSNDIFDKLLLEKNLKVSHRIHETTNETVAIIWKPGEVQFNDVIGEISSDDFSKDIFDYWVQSEIQLSVNWGLNYGSVSWLSCLWLASCGWEYSDISSLDQQELFNTAIKETNLESNFVLEPGSVKNHPEKEKLYKLLKTISSTSFANRYPIFSCNEEEDLEYNSYHFQTKLIHTSEKITSYQNNSKQLFEVPKLDNIKTFVGAGDAFLAGIVYQLHKNDRVDPSYAISVAQKYMTGTL